MILFSKMVQDYWERSANICLIMLALGQAGHSLSVCILRSQLNGCIQLCTAAGRINSHVCSKRERNWFFQVGLDRTGQQQQQQQQHSRMFPTDPRNRIQLERRRKLLGRIGTGTEQEKMRERSGRFLLSHPVDRVMHDHAG